MKKRLKYYGGMGYSYSPEHGKYVVKYGGDGDSGEEKEFTSLSEAIEFYESLHCGKALWDLNRMPELLECHYI